MPSPDASSPVGSLLQSLLESDLKLIEEIKESSINHVDPEDKDMPKEGVQEQTAIVEDAVEGVMMDPLRTTSSFPAPLPHQQQDRASPIGELLQNIVGFEIESAAATEALKPTHATVQPLAQAAPRSQDAIDSTANSRPTARSPPRHEAAQTGTILVNNAVHWAAENMRELEEENAMLRSKLADAEARIATFEAKCDIVDEDFALADRTICELKDLLDESVRRITVPKIVGDELELRVHTALDARGETMKMVHGLIYELSSVRAARADTKALSVSATETALARNAIVVELGNRVKSLEAQLDATTARATASSTKVEELKSQLAFSELLWQEKENKLRQQLRRLEADASPPSMVTNGDNTTFANGATKNTHGISWSTNKNTADNDEPKTESGDGSPS